MTRLEERGLLSRYLCPTDRRGIYTDVTAAGLELLEAAGPTNNAALREALVTAVQEIRGPAAVRAGRDGRPTACDQDLIARGGRGGDPAGTGGWPATAGPKYVYMPGSGHGPNQASCAADWPPLTRAL